MNKKIIILLIILLAAGLGFTGWLFLRGSQIVELAEGQSFKFKNYDVRVESVGDEDESAQVRVFNNNTKAIEYLYFSEDEGSLQEALGLKVEFQGAGLPNGFNQNEDDKIVRLKFRKE